MTRGAPDRTEVDGSPVGTVDLDLRRLRSFLVLAEEGHFARAARRLGISQSTLSDRVTGLESGLRVPLVDRSTQPVRLTAAGARLAAGGPDLLGHALDVVRAVRDEETEGVRVGYTNAGDPRTAAFVTHRFLQAQAGGRIDIVSDASPDLIRQVRARLLDAAFVHAEPHWNPGPGLASRPLDAVPLVVVGAGRADGRPGVAEFAVPADLIEIAAVRQRSPHARGLPGEREVLQHVRLGLGRGLLTAATAQGARDVEPLEEWPDSAELVLLWGASPGAAVRRYLEAAVPDVESL